MEFDETTSRLRIKRKSKKFFAVPHDVHADQDLRTPIMLRELTEAPLDDLLANWTLEIGDVGALNEALCCLKDKEETVSLEAVVESLSVVEQYRVLAIDRLCQVEAELLLAQRGLKVFTEMRDWIDDVDTGWVAFLDYLKAKTDIEVCTPEHYGSVVKAVETMREVVKSLDTAVHPGMKQGSYRSHFVLSCAEIYEMETGKQARTTATKLAIHQFR